MRIRQVKPSFWADSKVAELPESTRLFYIGLWMLADDAGWLRLDVTEIGLELYGYDPRARRERRVGAMLDALVAAGRVIRYPCGHGEIPRMPDHQRYAAATKRVYPVRNEHARCNPATSRGDPLLAATSSDDPLLPARNGKVGNGRGTERIGTVGAQTRDDGETEFSRKVPRPRIVDKMA